MTIISKTAHTIIISTLLLVLVLYGIANMVVFKRFIVLENKIISENVNRAHYALEKEITRLDNIAADWGPWDETYNFVQDLNEEYVKSNLVDTTFDNLKINFMIFVNSNERIVYSKYYYADKDKLVTSIENFQEDISKFTKLMHSKNINDKKSGIIIISGRPILVCSAPIVTSNFSGPIRGSLIIGKYLDEKLLQEISKETALNLSYGLFDSPNLSNDFKEAKKFFEKNDGNFIREISKQTIAGYVLVKDIEGKTVLILKTDIPREVYMESLNTKFYFLVALFVTFVIFNTVILWILKKRVLLPSIRQREVEEKLYHTVYYDQLTNLPNRLLFSKSMDDLLVSSKESSSNMALLCIDFDRFKLINESVGHSAGDKFLKDISEKISFCLNEDVTLARLGGDDFGVLIPNVKSDIEVIALCNKILSGINNEWVYNTRTFHITASIGIAIYPKHGEDGDTLLKNADAAMYFAKERGKNNYELYDSALSNRILQQVSMENSLMRAINKDEFVLYYQPQVNVNTSKVVGIEALIRWNNPECGIVSPQKFIPFAEQNGLIFSIDKWVLRSACLQSRYLEELGVEAIRVGINISSKQFEDPNFTKYIRDILNETKASADWLEFEITEGALMKEPENAIKVLKELKEMGIKIALDDFGTGYSSLAYLKKFPIDKLKIDKSFIRDMIGDLENTAIVKTIIDLAKNMGLTVTAEGVETKEQLEVLRALGCNEVQGYLFSKPVPLDELEQMLTFRKSSGV